ncbi:capsule polysaccharide transporter [Shimia sp. NS0008-38b]|uniref:capsule biosynthesis protein n=1 Tax=Shimia sp. NS0008-38b TaxID=3127653 RepID=UPI003104EE5E
MTTKPKAKKFRIRRSESSAAPAAAMAEQPAVASGTDGPAAPMSPPAPAQTPVEHPQAQARPPQGAQPPGQPPRAMKLATPTPKRAPKAQPQATTSPTQAAPKAAANPPTPQGAEAAIDAIKGEGLTGRQLRMARRMAQKNGLAATSDYDAVRLLREAGIDPFQRTNMLDLIPSDKNQKQVAGGRVQLPQTMPIGQANLPSTETMSPSEMRALEIGEIQKDIARRRRRRLLLLLARLSAFVFLPTAFAGWYFFSVATPMYSTKSEFLILQADNAGGAGLGSLLSGTQFATNQDSIATQSYLASKDAMLRLDRDEGFKTTFSQPNIDPIQRLDTDASSEDAYKIYKKYVKIGYDPTEGVIRMEVSSPDPSTSARFAQALIGYAETRVDDLSQRKREDQVSDARESLNKAASDRRDAQAALVSLQETSVLDPEGLIASLRQQISNVQIQLQEKELQLAALEDNTRPNQARLEGVRGDVGRLQSLLSRLESKMTEATAGESSLAQKTAQIQMAQADLATADVLMQSALQTLKQTELEANRQVRYLTTSVEPVASEDPSYPRSFENTVLAFLIFSGIYLMISLTASILREQVSS